MGANGFTLFVGNLSERVTEDILYELFLQAGPVESVRIPTVQGKQRSFGFVEFKHECSVPYAIKLMENTFLFDRLIKLDSTVKSNNTNNVSQMPSPVYGNGFRPNAKDRLGSAATNPLRGMNGVKRTGNDHMKPQKKSHTKSGSDSSPPQLPGDGGIPNMLELGGRVGINYPSQGKNFHDPYENHQKKHHHHEEKRNHNQKPNRFSKRSISPKNNRNRNEKYRNKGGKNRHSKDPYPIKHMKDPFYMPPYMF